ncbi:hypothetical protein VP01_1802g2 [Puccinia sorghi]|uniref:Uncharacterized protein n=1 Tax=Puccinia sorghi TaxID=27349 RepID=A0A0L6VE67_9BASI|nr:hypothetical protein VP01_1802g2 [Puccinia sorghi]
MHTTCQRISKNSKAEDPPPSTTAPSVELPTQTLPCGTRLQHNFSASSQGTVVPPASSSPSVKHFSPAPSKTLNFPSMHTEPPHLCSIKDQATTSTFSPPQVLETDSFGVAHIGSIAIVDDSDTFVDHRLAPELSQTALEQYNYLDTYLDTLKADRTKKRKKKKKT